MMQDDAVGAKWHPAKLEQALEELQAERDRRCDEKIEKGDAVGVVEFMGREDEPPGGSRTRSAGARARADSQGLYRRSPR